MEYNTYNLNLTLFSLLLCTKLQFCHFQNIIYFGRLKMFRLQTLFGVFGVFVFCQLLWILNASKPNCDSYNRTSYFTK